MIITIKSIGAEVINVSTNTEQKFRISTWQVQYHAIFPEANLTLGYHSLDGIIGWMGDPKDIEGMLNYIKSFYNES